MRQRLAIALCMCVSGMARAADAPKLTRSEPAGGATGVKLDVGVVRLHFDRDMELGSHTLWGSDKGSLPPLVDANAVHWRDSRCVELRVKTLQPNTTYAIQLNSPRKRNFRSATGRVPLPLTVVVFRTAPATGPATQGGQRPGMILEVRREVFVKGKIDVQGDKAYPMGFARNLRFGEEIKQIKDGQVTEVLRTIRKAKQGEVDSETGKVSTSEPVPAGTAFRVTFSGLASRVTPTTGVAVDEEIRSGLADRLDHGLLPADATWGYERSNPIKVGAPDSLLAGIAAATRWLAHLRDAKGRPFSVNRAGSVGTGIYGNILDLYELTDKDGAKRRLYVDCYHKDQNWRKVKAPKGMYLKLD